jgi:hypothetical protein
MEARNKEDENLYIEELLNLYFTPNIRMLKSTDESM